MLLCLILLGILMLGEAVVRHYPNSYKLKSEFMDRNARQVRTLILGNSHTYYGIDPKLIGSDAFNLANVSQRLEYDYFLLTKYYGQSVGNLKNVIVPVDFTGFFDGPLEGEDAARVAYYKIYMGNRKYGWSKYCLELFHIQKFKDKMAPAFKYLFTGSYSLNCDSTGFGIPTTPPDQVTLESMRVSSDRVISHYPGMDVQNVAYNHCFLTKIGEFCKKRGIRLIVVSVPVWPEYYSRIGKKELAVTRLEMQRMERDYSAVCGDYMNDSRFTAIDNFSDASHLSQLGAERFTSVLKEDFAL